jgi:hypothetical protein
LKVDRTIIILSASQAVLLVLVSVIGLFTPGFYSAETLNWQVHSAGQDLVDLFIISPVLILISLFAARKNKVAFLLWNGINIYLLYTFIIYCFDVHFNKLFIIYCLILGLSFYSCIYFLLTQSNFQTGINIFNKTIVKIIAVYFLIISFLFYALWLSEIIPSIIGNRVSKGLVETDLPTNPVHVLDLSVVLPGFFLMAALLFKKKIIAVRFVPGILMFCILMDITIGSMAFFMNINQVTAGYSTVIVMTTLALLSIIFLGLYLRILQPYLSKS